MPQNTIPWLNIVADADYELASADRTIVGYIEYNETFIN